METDQDTLLRSRILAGLCYTSLVYGRINKKLHLELTEPEIEKMVWELVADPRSKIQQRGKNYYVTDPKRQIRTTINRHNYRVITMDKMTSKT